MSCAVILPVRNGERLLRAGLTPLVRQAAEVGAEVIVVDDGSTDNTGSQAALLGARVLELEDSRGPYAARNAGWRHSDADVAVFTDVRCRPESGWLSSLLAPLSRTEVSMVGGGGRVAAGSTLGARLTARLQPYDFDWYANHPFRPYAPTANLAVRRTLLEELGGFIEVRSGADAELCWRAQLRLGAHMVMVRAPTVTIEPRHSVREVVAQYHRYGRSTAWLERRFHARWTDPYQPVTSQLKRLGALVRRPAETDWPVEWAVLASSSAFAWGLWIGRREGSSG